MFAKLRLETCTCVCVSVCVCACVFRMYDAPESPMVMKNRNRPMGRSLRDMMNRNRQMRGCV